MLLMLFLQPAIWDNETIELYKFIGKRYYHDHDQIMIQHIVWNCEMCQIHQTVDLIIWYLPVLFYALLSFCFKYIYCMVIYLLKRNCLILEI